MTKKIAIIIIFIISFTTFSNTLLMDFVWDDVPAIVLNDLIKDYKNIPSFFTSGIPHAKPVHYRPLVYTSLAIDYLIWGKNPMGFHLTNVIFHVANSILFFIVLLKLTNKKPLIPLLTSCLFSVYPIHSDLVAWIMARADLFCAFFLLISFYFYLRYKGEKDIKFISLSFLAYIFSLLSKEIAVMFVFVIIIFELIFIEKKERELFKLLVLFSIPIIVFLLARAYFLPTFIKINHPIETRIFSSLTFVKTYIRILIFPVNLKVLYHGIPIYNSFFEKEVIFSFVLISLLTALFTIICKKNKILFFGYLWFIINIIPVSGLPKIIDISPIAERYLYVPSIGFFLIITQILDYTLKKYHQIYKEIITTLFIIILIIGIITYKRNYHWKDNFCFLKKMTYDSPKYWEARKVLAYLYFSKNELSLAENELRKLAEIVPDDYEAYNDLGTLYTKMGKIKEAEEMFKYALKLNPDYDLAIYNLANIYAYNENFTEAEKLLLTLISSGLKNPPILKRLGLVYFMTNRLENAKEKFTQVLALDPKDEEAKYYLEIIINKNKK